MGGYRLDPNRIHSPQIVSSFRHRMLQFEHHLGHTGEQMVSKHDQIRKHPIGHNLADDPAKASKCLYKNNEGILLDQIV